VLVAIASLDQSLREHLAGFRSHSVLLGALLAVASAVPLFFLTSLPQELILVLSLLVFATAWYSLRDLFRRRAGGLSFRA
jgi:hypothetical protein